jgi:hypothetical protein
MQVACQRVSTRLSSKLARAQLPHSRVFARNIVGIRITTGATPDERSGSDLVSRTTIRSLAPQNALHAPLSNKWHQTSMRWRPCDAWASASGPHFF